MYVDIGNASSGEKIWLDEYQNYGVLLLIEDDVIHSLILKPLYYFKDKWTQLTYNLPIKDEWLVYWGGAMNYLITTIIMKRNVMLMI